MNPASAPAPGFGFGFGATAAPTVAPASDPATAAAPGPATDQSTAPAVPIQQQQAHSQGAPAATAATSTSPAAASAAPQLAKKAAKPAQSTPAPVVDLMAKLRAAVADGALTNDARQDITTRFTAPFQPPASSSTGAAPAAGLSDQQKTTTGFGAQPASASTRGWGVTPQPAAAAPVTPGAQLHQASQLSSAQEKNQSTANAQNVRVATEFLNVLLMCDSGFNNIEVPTDAASGADVESVKGLHAAVGGIAASAAANIVTYLSRELVPTATTATAIMGSADQTASAGEGLIACLAQHTVHVSAAPPVRELERALGGDNTGSASGTGSSSGGGGLLVSSSLAQSNPILLSAQCLYLLTRHFQMQASLLKSLLDLLHQLLRQVRLDLQGRPIEFSRFRASSETRALSTLLWLVVFSVVNVMAVWKKLRGTDGRLEHNALLRTAAAETLDTAITTMRREFEVQADETASSLGGGGGGSGHQFLPGAAQSGSGGLLGRVSASRRAGGAVSDAYRGTEAGQLTVDGKVVGGYGQFNHRWEIIVQAYLSILTLAEACFLRGKQDDASYEKACDKAVEAFLGDRETNPTSMCRGKAVKRMHQLMPLPSTVFVPLEILYVAPYEVLSYLFDYMVQFLRRISELEAASFARYLRQMEALEERVSASNPQSRGPAGTPGAMPTQSHHTGFASRHHHYGQAMRALLPDARNYAMDGVSQHSGIAQQLVPFTSEMAHLLETLSACLQHLPPEVLNPDLDADCAATFFILENFTKHLGQVLKLQRSSASLWESFTLKTVARYLDVLTMIGRNPQYIERVVKLLSNTQAECPELEWGGLVNQALECTGMSHTSAGTDSGLGGVGSLTTRAAALPDVEEEGVMHQPYRQFLPSFSRKCQQSYVASFFMLMRQMFLHPELREIVRKYFTLDLGLAMLHAERHSQSTLGSTLSLISALINNAEDAHKALEHLRAERFLAPWTNVGAMNTSASGGGGGASFQSSSASHMDDRYATRNQLADDPTHHFETRSLLGHCEYEATVGRYSITIGFLNLLISLLRYDAPGMESFEIYTSVTHFVAHKIFIGISRRTFEKETERGTVTALAAAALRHALHLCFTTDGSVSFIPFQTVMATVKAPSDVLGELLGVVFKATARAAELTVHECAAARQCLRLLSTAIQAPSRHQRNDFCFDARALNSAILPFRALLLCGGRDSLLTHAVLRVLTLLPATTLTEASHMWYAHSHYFTSVVANFSGILDPDQTGAPLFYAPPELILLDYDWGPQGALKSLSPVAVLEENRSALLDLLIQHAAIREPSTAAWLCGFYTEVASPQGLSHLGDTSILFAVMNGAQSAAMANTYPLLAVKYTHLLYALRANTLYGASTIRPLMEYFRCHTLFLELQNLRPDQCNPLLLSKYAYVLKMLSLEVAYVYTVAPDQLDVNSHDIPSVEVEVALSLFERSGRETEELSVPVGTSVAADFANDPYTQGFTSVLEGQTAGTRPSGLSSRSATGDIADWLRQAFVRLPSFPACRPPPSAKDLYVMRAADGVVQFNIDNVFNALQQENIRIHRVPLTMAETREALQMYVEANYCFLMYASAVNFVEGWCELVNIAFSVVRGIPQGRLRAFVQHILTGAEASMTMTRAAQEQVTFRLFSCLSTLMAQLKKQVEWRARAEHQRSSSHTTASRLGGTGAQRASGALTYGGRSGQLNASGARNSVYGSTGVVDMSTVKGQASERYEGSLANTGVPGSRRRTRDRAEASLTVRDPNQSVYSTVAGTHYSLLSGSGRTALVAQQQQQQHLQRRDRLERLGAWSYQDTWAAIGEENQCLVRPLVNAVVTWGTRVCGVRVDLYASLLCLSLIPGVTMEEIMLRRQQDALFELLASDIVGANTDHTRRRGALELLILLLQMSPTLRSGFVAASSSSFVGMATGLALGATAEQCAVALLKLVDDGVYAFLTKGGAELGELLWLIRGTFDLLSVLSQDNVSNVLGSTVLDMCLNLRSWTQSSQVVLGHRTDNDLLQPSTAPLEANKEVLLRLLLGAARWFNVLLSQACESPRLLDALQQFVRVYRHLIEYALNSPIANAHVRPLTTVSITLYAEVTSMLEWLSASPLVESCRVLVPALALTRLLGAMANEQFLDGHWFTDGYAASSDALVHTSSYDTPMFGTAGPASAKQRDLVFLTVRNVAHLLVRTELGALHIIGLQPDAMFMPGQPSDDRAGGLMHRQLRTQPEEMESVVTSLYRLADVTLRIANAPGGAVGTTNVTLEALLLALHALVCLCHSFVLPMSEEKGKDASGSSAHTADAPRTSDRFDMYLQTVPVANLLSTLRRVQQGIYALQALNADYRAGMYSTQTATGFAITTDSMSNQLTAHAGDRLFSIVAPQTATHGSLRDDRSSASHPSTPLSLSVGGSKSTAAKATAGRTSGGPPRATTPATPRISLAAGRGGNSTLLAPSEPTMTSRQAGPRPHTSVHFAEDENDLYGMQSQTATFNETDAETTAVPEGTTIGALMTRTDPDATNATSYVAFPGATDLSGVVTTREARDGADGYNDPDAFVYAGEADWGAILGLEQTSRQLKIGVANAIAAAEEAAKTLGLPTSS